MNITELRECGLPDTAKIEYYPYNKSQIYFRLENLADQFDYGRAQKLDLAPYVRVDLLALKLYEKVFGAKTDLDHIYLMETTLSANEEHYWMLWDKVQWKGNDDDYIDNSFFPRDKSTYEIALEPQRMRAFFVDFTNYYFYDDWTDDWIEPSNTTIVNSTISSSGRSILI